MIYIFIRGFFEVLNALLWHNIYHSYMQQLTIDQWQENQILIDEYFSAKKDKLLNPASHELQFGIWYLVNNRKLHGITE